MHEKLWKKVTELSRWSPKSYL